jgi:hypothetical protein
MTTQSVKARAPRASRKPTVEAVQKMYYVNESTQRAVETKAFSYADVQLAGKVSASVEHGAIMALFSGSELPTFKAFQESVKASNKTKPVAERVPVPNAKMAGYGAIYQMFNNIAKIRQAEELGFAPLAYWNAKAITAKRATEPNISYILKGARAVINGEKDEPTPFEIFEKGLKLAYKGALEFKNDKKAQARVAKLLAIAEADGIVLEAEAETEAEAE